METSEGKMGIVEFTQEGTSAYERDNITVIMFRLCKACCLLVEWLLAEVTEVPYGS
jgi:hypothetical protein